METNNIYQWLLLWYVFRRAHGFKPPSQINILLLKISRILVKCNKFQCKAPNPNPSQNIILDMSLGWCELKTANTKRDTTKVKHPKSISNTVWQLSSNMPHLTLFK